MGCELYVSRVGAQTWAALREAGRTVELRVESAGERTTVGQILRARVAKVVPAIQSVFLDVGRPRDAFLHVSELFLAGDAAAGRSAVARRLDLGPAEAQAPPPTLPPIEDRLRRGRDLVIQIIREASGSKGDRATCFVALPSRLLVFLPQVAFRGISRRIVEPAERERLVGLVAALPDPSLGFVARTAAAGIDGATLARDAERLVAEWRAIAERAATAAAPAVVHRELDLTLRMLRDAPAGELDGFVLDDAREYARARAYAAEFDPRLASRIRLHTGASDLFESQGLRQELEQALQPRVRLASGGDIVIEPTEALVSIDVNTGRSASGRDPVETNLKTNLEAAREIPRQLRLRGLGGIVVIDFIDMPSAEHRQRVRDCLEGELRSDPARTRVVGSSELGLVQLTRKRSGSAISDRISRACPHCAGRGRIPVHPDRPADPD